MSLGRKFKLNSGVMRSSYINLAANDLTAICACRRDGSSRGGVGYRHIDSAAVGLNEAEVGRGWKKLGVPREGIFLTSKLWNTHHHPSHVEEALDKTVKDLQTNYLDLYLLYPLGHILHTYQRHIPASRPGHKRFRLVDIPIGDTWAAREKLVNAGKIRSIGVSNLFTIEKMEELLNTADIPPAVNQIEAHPYLLQPKIYISPITYNSMHILLTIPQNILPAAYSPLGNNIFGGPRYTKSSYLLANSKLLENLANMARGPRSEIARRPASVQPDEATPGPIEAEAPLDRASLALPWKVRLAGHKKGNLMEKFQKNSNWVQS
ncbi:aldehyde reductase, putative [Aspergillus fumigatus A1163]|uniref:D-xylose reductase [NAD(P)H] n=1 Tax=Aspergillus fumigatus (strain CBS 144.89 / FGSC A1163 / CEA10) TaxID=451804 RepID=B0Y616_ASPFC|nr:aldehyde reductase, putative [Aspergillus fumigatus A1163]